MSTNNDCNWLEEMSKPKRQPNSLSKAERDALILSIDNWCHELANRHQRACEASDTRDVFDADDLYGVAIIAACEASQFYDPTTGYAFTTYATSRIQQRLKQFTDQRRRVRAECNDDAIALYVRHVADEDDDDSEAEEDSEPDERADLQAAILRQVHPETAEILKLYASGHDADQIATQVGKPVRVVQMELRNAAEVAKRVQDKWDGEDGLFQ